MIGYEVIDVVKDEVIASFVNTSSLQVKDGVVAFMKDGDIVGVIMLSDHRYVRAIAQVKETANAAK
jgi:hypothetical protein